MSLIHAKIPYVYTFKPKQTAQNDQFILILSNCQSSSILLADSSDNWILTSFLIIVEVWYELNFNILIRVTQMMSQRCQYRSSKIGLRNLFWLITNNFDQDQHMNKCRANDSVKDIQTNIYLYSQIEFLFYTYISTVVPVVEWITFLPHHFFRFGMIENIQAVENPWKYIIFRYISQASLSIMNTLFHKYSRNSKSQSKI